MPEDKASVETMGDHSKYCAQDMVQDLKDDKNAVQRFAVETSVRMSPTCFDNLPAAADKVTMTGK